MRNTGRVKGDTALVSCGCRSLWAAVASQAIEDAERGVDQRWPFTRDGRIVLELAGLEPEAVRDRLRQKWRQQAREKPRQEDPAEQAERAAEAEVARLAEAVQFRAALRDTLTA